MHITNSPPPLTSARPDPDNSNATARNNLSTRIVRLISAGFDPFELSETQEKEKQLISALKKSKHPTLRILADAMEHQTPNTLISFSHTKADQQALTELNIALQLAPAQPV